MPEIIAMGGLHMRFLHSRETGSDIDVFEMTVQPDGAMPVAHHHESWDEMAYGLEGELVFRVAGQDVVVGPGGSAYIPRGVVHAFRNDGTMPARCLIVLTPAALGPQYFREFAALLAETPPDRARMVAVMRRYGLVPAPHAA